MTTDRYLVDNSVWARLPSDPEVAAALEELVDLNDPDDVMICAPIAAEIGFGARTGTDHTAVLEHLSAFRQCPEHPSGVDALSIQNRLWNRGLLRAVGALDIVIAAYAIRNDAVLLHYDRDFEHIAAVEPAFRHRWVVPRGTLR